jgi:hypothetical protein
MNATREPRPSRRKWVAAGFLVLICVVLFFLITGSGQLNTPHVTVTFAGFTNGPAQRHALFTFRNESALLVHLYANEIRDIYTPCQAETFWPNQPLTISVPIPIPIPTPPTSFNRQLTVTNAAPLTLPAPIRFYLRRQDTRLEDAREMLDSVLRAVSIRIPGLNPDSSRNEFRVNSEIPAER